MGLRFLLVRQCQGVHAEPGSMFVSGSTTLYHSQTLLRQSGPTNVAAHPLHLNFIQYCTSELATAVHTPSLPATVQIQSPSSIVDVCASA